MPPNIAAKKIHKDIPPKLRDAIAGPGHRPAVAQPAPNRTDPTTRLRPNFGSGFAGNDPPTTGVRPFVYAHASAIGIIAPPITKANVGSHAPKTSSQPWTLAVLVIPDTNKPPPKNKPATKAIIFRIRSTPKRGAMRPSSDRPRQCKTQLPRSRAGTGVKCRTHRDRMYSHWQCVCPRPPTNQQRSAGPHCL